MKGFEQILSTALLGTGRGATPLPAIDPLVSEVLSSTSSDSPESQLLSTAVVLSLYERAGTRAIKGIAPPPRSNKDAAPLCSQRAGEILEQLLREGPRELIPEWLSLAHRDKRRPPAKLLPRLLDAAVQHKELRASVEAIVDQRGVWLMSLNPIWQFAAITENHEEAWQTGNRDQRIAALRAIRGADPARARTLVEATWKEDAADDRVRFLEIIALQLSSDDEAFLESCLDDRSKNVRESAAALLSRLADSQFLARMTSRVRDCLVFTPATAGALLKLKRPKPASIEVKLPAEFDKSWQRDSIVEKPPSGVGQKQWWLRQMVALVPPAFWSSSWKAPAAQIVAADCEFADLLREAWVDATLRNPDSDWALALIQTSASTAKGAANLDLLRCVHESKRDEALTIVLNSRRGKQMAEIIHAIVETRLPMTEKAGAQLLEKLDPELLLGQTKLVQLLHIASLSLVEKMLEPLSGKPYTGKAADELLRFIALRREMHGSFKS